MYYTLRKTLSINLYNTPYKTLYKFAIFKPSYKTIQPKTIQSPQPSTLQKTSILEDLKFQKKQLKTIDQINKYFQGIRMNTKYAKFYNQDYIKNIQTYKQIRKITQLPFRHQLNKNQKIINIQGKINPICKYILQKLNKQQLNKKLIDMTLLYFTDLFQNKRNIKIQPNFQRQARRVITSLSNNNNNNGYKFKLVKNQDYKIQIKYAELFKGIEVIRNNNYSIDSYQILKQTQFTYYKLWQKGSYKIPQQQWKTQRNLLMRIAVQTTSPYTITSTPSSTTTTTTSKTTNPSITSNNPHTFIFEMDLIHPPRFSQYQTNQRQYLKKYRPNLDNLMITNVDSRNIYSAFTFEEKDKKDRLINKLLD